MTDKEKKAVALLQIAQGIKADKTEIDLETAKTLYYLINSQKTEIERLKFENLDLSLKRVIMLERIDIVDNARKKSIREFADNVKIAMKTRFSDEIEALNPHFNLVSMLIDDLVEEMTEDNNA